MMVSKQLSFCVAGRKRTSTPISHYAQESEMDCKPKCEVPNNKPRIKLHAKAT